MGCKSQEIHALPQGEQLPLEWDWDEDFSSSQTFPPSGTAWSLWNCPRLRNLSGLFNPWLHQGKSQGHSEGSVPPLLLESFLLCGKCRDGSRPAAGVPVPSSIPGIAAPWVSPEECAGGGDEQSQPRVLSSVLWR